MPCKTSQCEKPDRREGACDGPRQHVSYNIGTAGTASVPHPECIVAVENASLRFEMLCSSPQMDRNGRSQSVIRPGSWHSAKEPDRHRAPQPAAGAAASAVRPSHKLPIHAKTKCWVESSWNPHRILLDFGWDLAEIHMVSASGSGPMKPLTSSMGTVERTSRGIRVADFWFHPGTSRMECWCLASCWCGCWRPGRMLAPGPAPTSTV